VRYKNAFREVMRDYEVARERAEELHAARREEAYKKAPRLKEIDKSLGETGLSLARLALAGDTEAIEKARATSDALKTERLSLLAKKRINKNYFSPVYNCENCADTGYITHSLGGPAIACSCLKQRLIDEYYSLSNMREVLRDENFDNFDIRLFNTQIIEKEGLSPQANMETNYRIAISFVQNFDDEFQNLLLYGETGLGKTFICHCIAKAVLDAGFTVLYLTAPRLFKLVQAQQFRRENAESAEEQLDAVQDADVLILDDLGAEFSNTFTDSALFDVINQRLLDGRSTVISTNLPPDELMEQYTERIASRFAGYYKMIKFIGDDIRIKK